MLLQRPRTKILRPAAKWLARGLVYANTLSSHNIKDRNPILGKAPSATARNGCKVVSAPWGAPGVGFTAAAGGTDTSDSFTTAAPLRMSARRTVFFRIALPTSQSDGDVFWDTAVTYERLQWDSLNEILTWRRIFSGTTGIWSFAGLFGGGTYSLAIAHDGTTSPPVAYVNGIPVSVTVVQAPSGTVVTDTSSVLTFGGRTIFGQYAIPMKVGDLCVFNEVLTQSEVQELHRSRSALWADAPGTAWSGGLLDWVAPALVRRSQPQTQVAPDRRALALFTPSRAGRFTTRAGSMTQVSSPFGLGLESSSTGNRIEQLNPNGVLLPSSNLSLFFVGRIGPTTGGIGVAACLNGVTTYSSMLYVFGGADYAGFYPYSGGQVGCTLVPVKGCDIVMVGSYDGATARVGVRNLNTNQRQINSSALSGSTDFDRFRVGPTFSSQIFSTYFSGAFLSPLSTAEINAILDNPWRLLARDKARLHGVAPLSSGIPSLSLATVINILSSQATPRVTITF